LFCDNNCVFRRKPATDSDRFRPPCNPDFTELNATLVSPSNSRQKAPQNLFEKNNCGQVL
jgi:hypothetical protein